METYEIQQQFFNHLKTLLPPHLSLVDELGDLLGLSADSVYRRIRGEKPIALSELKTICEKYHLSLDHVLQLQNDSVVFQAPGINGKRVSFVEYMNGLISQVKYFNSFEKKQVLYLCKDLPPWYFYIYPEIAAFKTFVWIKTIQNNPEYANKKFSLKEYPFEDCYKLGQELIRLYNQIPCIELWNYESIISTTRQIEYYRDAGIFANVKELDIIVDSFERSLDHIQDQAEKGCKFFPGESDVNHKAPLKLYVNEVILGNNTILVELNDNKYSFITYNVLDYLITKDARFTDIVFSNFYTLMSRSALISETGEKERNRFFRSLKLKVQDLRR
jgi:hypothetical protein